MYHYQHHIGDFNNATRHLSRLEKSVYRDLIELYYETEMPLQCDRIALARRALVRGDDELAAMDAVLAEFFTLDGDYYRHSRCDLELGKVYEKSDKARVSAEKRWAKHNKKCATDANAMRTHSERNAKGMLPVTRNPSPVTKDKTLVAVATALPDYLNSDAWFEWVSYRREAKKKLTPSTIAKQHKFLSQYDKPTQAVVINQSITHGWAGLFDPKPAGGFHATSNRPATPAERMRAELARIESS